MARARTDERPAELIGRRPITARRRELLAIAARLFAERGYGGTTIDDLGSAAGISGPALYWHFPSKDALLAEMLTDISDRLLVGARQCVAIAGTPCDAVRALVGFQAAFAVENPALITVHQRELPHLTARDRQVVRRTQRRYLEVWVSALGAVAPAVDERDLRTATHGLFGLLNATPNIAGQDPDHLTELLGSIALGAIDALTAGAISVV